MDVQSVLIEVATEPEVSEVETIIGFTSKQLACRSVYEKRRWLYLMVLPLMWLLTVYVMSKKAVCKMFGWSDPKTNSYWFDGLGPCNRKIKEGAASWKALDVIYNYKFRSSSFVDDLWIGMMNAQAVRNRFKLARQEVRRAILRFSNHEEVRLISLACGSAQAVIEVMAEFKARGVVVRTILVDVDSTALEYAYCLADRCGVLDQMDIRRASVVQVVKIARDFRPQVIEMLGLLDYLSWDKAIRLVTKVRESLESKGVFLTCNIAPNVEQYFLKWVINWPMIYRSASELIELASRAGFSDCRIIYEPLKIHGLVIAQKG